MMHPALVTYIILLQTLLIVDRSVVGDITKTISTALPKRCPLAETLNGCQCHMSDNCINYNQSQCLLLHCMRLKSESQLSERLIPLKRLSSSYPIDLIVSSSQLQNLGNDFGNSQNVDGSSWRDLNIVGLRIYHNNISNMSESAFKSLNKLYHFSLMENAAGDDMRQVDFKRLMRALHHLPHLQDIFVSVYRIEELDFNVFKPFSGLKALSIITQNLGTVIGPNSFEFINLRSFMFHTDIEHFPNYIVWRMPALEEIVFISKHYSLIHQMDFATLSLPKLKQLTITFTAVESVDNASFTSLYTLKTLVLSQNQISKMSSSSFKNLTNLQELDLSYNKLTHLSNNIFAPLKSLQKLVLSNNQLGPFLDFSLFNSFKTTLNTLVVSHNILLEFPMLRMPDEFFTNLTKIDVSYNHITHLPKFDVDSVVKVAKDCKVTELNLAHNNLDAVPPSFLEVFAPKLETLDLSNNEIKAFDFKYLKDSENLHIIDISKNHIKSLSGIDWLMELGEQLQYVGLSGNPYVCDCNMAMFMNWYADWYIKLPEDLQRRQNADWEKMSCKIIRMENNQPDIATTLNIMSIDENQKRKFCNKIPKLPANTLFSKSNDEYNFDPLDNSNDNNKAWENADNSLNAINKNFLRGSTNDFNLLLRLIHWVLILLGTLFAFMVLIIIMLIFKRYDIWPLGSKLKQAQHVFPNGGSMPGFLRFNNHSGIGIQNKFRMFQDVGSQSNTEDKLAITRMEIVPDSVSASITPSPPSSK